MYEFMYKAAKVSLKEAVVSFQKPGGINMKLAAIAAQYIALNDVYKNRAECEKILKEILDSHSAVALQKELSKEGFLTAAPQIYKLLEQESFDISAASSLFKDDNTRGFMRYVNIFTNIRPALPERVTLLYRFLKILEESCRRKSRMFSPKRNNDYSKEDLQRLLNLVSNMLPECVAKCKATKDSVTYGDKIKSFGSRLKFITQKNNDVSGNKDHKILLAIAKLFEEYGFTLDDEFRVEVAKKHKSFAEVRDEFLTQRRANLLLLAISLKIQRSSLDDHALSKSLQIINAIKNLSDVDSSSDLEEMPLYEEGDITDEINNQADLFIEYFTNKKRLPKEIVQDIMSQGLVFGRALARDLFVAGRYLMVGVDISLIALSLVAGVNVFIANSILILSMSAITLAAFIAADCANAYYNLDSVSAKFYQSCLDFYDLLSGKDKAGKEIVICYDGYVIYDANLKLENSRHSGLVLGIMPEDMSSNSRVIGHEHPARCFSDSFADPLANYSTSTTFPRPGTLESVSSIGSSASSSDEDSSRDNSPHRRTITCSSQSGSVLF